MKYFNVEIFDGIPHRDCNLEPDIPMEDQWYHLTQDIAYIEYNFNNLRILLQFGFFPKCIYNT